MHKSVATIKSPEFLNLQPLEINPLMSSCEIKVLYIGQNRNHSFITKEVATEMAKTLRGAPIVGYFRNDVNDFGDHGEQIVINGDGIQFNCLTRPYGFVAPDAKVWFQEFEDEDEFGNKIVHEYLMTTGFLWTEQFEEAKRVIAKGNNQSMELDEKTLEGHWSTDFNSNIDFFIIDDATFSKLCLLGEDVEPCFEGASVTAPNVSMNFSNKESDFKQTLFSMMKDLKFALERSNEVMEDNKNNEIVEDVSTEFSIPETVIEEEPTADFKKEEEKEEDTTDSKKDEEEDTSDSKEEKEDKEGDKKFEKDTNDIEETPIDYQKAFIELTHSFEKLSTTCNSYIAELQELRKFKADIENAQKDELINKFYMLSDEDKADVITNKEKYSLADIEAKLSVICFRKKVNFDSDNKDKKEDIMEDITTYALSDDDCFVPAWIKAVMATEKQKHI